MSPGFILGRHSAQNAWALPLAGSLALVAHTEGVPSSRDHLSTPSILVTTLQWVLSIMDAQVTNNLG